MSRADYFRQYNLSRGVRLASQAKTYEASRGPRKRAYVRRERLPKTCLGIDGEGFESGSVYAYMACYGTSQVGRISVTENLKGLTTQQCIEFLLDLPKEPLKFGFSLGYDYTKILQDLDNKSLYELCRPELRMAQHGPPNPVHWRAKDGTHYGLNMLSSRLTVEKWDSHRKECYDSECDGCAVSDRTILWDVFRFFQSSFITACLAWDIINKEEFETLKEMKAKRPEFKRPKNENDPEWVEVKQYCGLECEKMADLASRLLAAHEEVGLPLRAFFGAGSTGAAMLNKMNAREFIRKPKEIHGKKVLARIDYPIHLLEAIACGFFGGRFEISQYGPIEQKVWSYDISSAYPYAFTFLPCLVHGEWRHLKKGRDPEFLRAIETAHSALVQYRLPYVDRAGYKTAKDGYSHAMWGPFPFRVGKGNELIGEGNIVFPVTSGGGWVWRDELLAGAQHFPNVEMLEAWVYETPCSCRVLRDVMPENYKNRCMWGKEGKGQVVKLGMNSCYGKTAQTKGQRPPYQEFVWAGMTTSSCRAQVLHALGKNPESIVMIATDGIFSTEPMILPAPRDTGTEWCRCQAPKENDLKKKPHLFRQVDGNWEVNKPLGGWEEEKLDNGIFLIRPGIAFPLDTASTKDERDRLELKFKARGVGKAILLSKREEVLASWYAHGPQEYETRKQLFYGCKSQVYAVKPPPSEPDRVTEYRRTERYGTFDYQPQKISYNPLPKRPAVVGRRLLTHALRMKDRSQAYGPVLGMPRVTSEHVLELMNERQLELEQPDADEGLDVREF